MSIVLVAVLCMAGGAAVGFILCAATMKQLRRRIKKLQAQAQGTAPKKMGVMDKVLVLEALILTAYTVAALVVFWHTGAEPTTLTACVFSVCGLENGVMGWIKTNKEKGGEPSGATPEREEPPDAGIKE